jgi:hypothetical protein
MKSGSHLLDPKCFVRILEQLKSFVSELRNGGVINFPKNGGPTAGLFRSASYRGSCIVDFLLKEPNN